MLDGVRLDRMHLPCLDIYTEGQLPISIILLPSILLTVDTPYFS
jgi:hypothetical protein